MHLSATLELYVLVS